MKSSKLLSITRKKIIIMALSLSLSLCTKQFLLTKFFHIFGNNGDQASWSTEIVKFPTRIPLIHPPGPYR